MVNVIGLEGDNAALLAIADTHLHRYDKAERPGRKLAHVNVVASSHAELLEKVRACQALIPDAPPLSGVLNLRYEQRSRLKRRLFNF